MSSLLCTRETPYVFRTKLATTPSKWDKTGNIVEVGQNDQYLIRVDGSRRITTRNRRFIRELSSHSFLPQLNTPGTYSQTVIPQPDVASQQSEQVQDRTFSQQPDVIARQPDQTITQPYATTSAQEEAPTTTHGKVPLHIPETQPVAGAIMREWIPSRPQRNRRSPDRLGEWVE